MFEQTLVESSTERLPVLRNVHWAVSAAFGMAGFILWYTVLSLFFGQPASRATLIVQSVIFGFIPPFITVLMLCYVYVDSRRIRASTALWIILTVVLWVVGFLFYLILSASRTKNYKKATMPIAYIIEAIIVGIFILVPLLHTQVLPRAQLLTALAAPPPPPPPAPPPPPPAPKIIVHPVSLADLMKAPTVIPKQIKIIKEQPIPANAVAEGVPGGVPGGSAGGVLGGMLGSMTPPPPPPKAKVPSKINVGGNVEEAKLIYGPKPDYPAIAKMARIQGEVRLQALISRDGSVKNLSVLSGSPMLVQAAENAVKQWKYEPTLLNGVAVEVATEIDVDFTLSD
jgi:periplasmic protein TonB